MAPQSQHTLGGIKVRLRTLSPRQLSLLHDRSCRSVAGGSSLWSDVLIELLDLGRVRPDYVESRFTNPAIISPISTAVAAGPRVGAVGRIDVSATRSRSTP